uniref:DEP domain-containing protein n=1 Tax=Elaeophora elaphi TaxID=1147741 RepID=A0A0R3RIQ1_9BILA
MKPKQDNVFRVYLCKKGDKKCKGRRCDVILSSKDLPGLRLGSILEISPSSNQRFYVQHSHEDVESGTYRERRIYIEKAIADMFSLSQNQYVTVKIVEKKQVALDNIEIAIKERYVSRSDMWRYRNCLIDTCAYNGKKVEWLLIPSTVINLWAKGEVVRSGYVSEDTRIVFRTASAMILVYVQMSSEMWDFDPYGDLYFEKCVNGFFPQLFEQWNKQHCAHLITFIVTSRWYFNEEVLDEEMKKKLSIDYRGKYYQDFYRVIVQNEHYDDWRHVLSKLRLVFSTYKNSVKEFIYKQLNMDIVKEEFAMLSTAADGNFLQVLNLSMNEFSVHFTNRRFETVGQQIIFVSAGGGVFNVDPDLIRMTKQRLIDMGISLDLVCLGEQPLHAVPLFVFQRTNGIYPSEDYLIPHWMNYSYYQMSRRSAISIKFKPRINLPDELLRDARRGLVMETNGSLINDMDAADERAFSSLIENSAMKSNASEFAKELLLKKNVNYGDTLFESHHGAESAWQNRFEKFAVSSLPEPDLLMDPLECKKSQDILTAVERRPLINPFKPEEFSVRTICEFTKQLSVPITANRRRWIHVFPVDKLGRSKLAHHFVAGKSVVNIIQVDEPEPSETTISVNSSPSCRSSSAQLFDDVGGSRVTGLGAGGKRCVWAWGSTGEEKWNPDMEIGVDWKSLIRTALLPLTTDFFPDRRSIIADYTVKSHELLVYFDLVREWLEDSNCNDLDRLRNLVFDQLVYQRLQRGFQIVILDKQMLHAAIGVNEEHLEREYTKMISRECFLSFNRIYHRLCMINDRITVTQFLPKLEEPYETPEVVKRREYTYLFQIPDSLQYTLCSARFQKYDLPNLDWNFFDIEMQNRYIPRLFQDDMSCFASRFLLTPLCVSITKTIITERNGGDKYMSLFDPSFSRRQEEGFLKFVEVLNRFRRKTSPRHKRLMASTSDIESRIYSVENVDVLLNSWRETCLPLYSQDSTSRFPSCMFLTVEFIAWLMANVSELSSRQAALEFAGSLISTGKIRMLQPTETIDDLNSSVSTEGHWHEFRCGFFLCYFVNKYISDDKMEERETWSRVIQCEVGEKCSSHTLVDCAYRLNSVEMKFYAQSQKTADSGGHEYLPQHISQFMEWGKVFYEKTFYATKSFEIGVRWFMANSQTVAETVRHWCSKAANLSFHMFPVPEDPFPHALNPLSPPLHCPVVIPFRPSGVQSHYICRLITTIITAFGFIEMGCSAHHLPQYVHLTGGMFLMYDEVRQAFLWSWNHMLSHRYRANLFPNQMFQFRIAPKIFKIICCRIFDHFVVMSIIVLIITFMICLRINKLILKPIVDLALTFAVFSILIGRDEICSIGCWSSRKWKGLSLSTYCSVVQQHCQSVGRNVFFVNLDPAAEKFTYNAAVDVRELINVDDVQEDKQLVLGPNGGLVFCMEYLVQNLDWLHDQLNEGEDDYFIFDCPGSYDTSSDFLFHYAFSVPIVISSKMQFEM